MPKLKRWAIGNKIFLGLILLIAFIGYVDTLQINAFFSLNSVQAWDLYNEHILPSFIKLWVLLMAVPAIVYYLFTKDKSEAIGIFAAGFIMLVTGLEDVFYFIFSSQPMTLCMQWFNDLGAPVALWSKHIFNETCVSPDALVSFAALGVVLAYITFKELQKAKW